MKREIKYKIQVKAKGEWMDQDAEEYDSLRYVKVDLRQWRRCYPKTKFRLVRVTTTREVVKEGE